MKTLGEAAARSILALGTKAASAGALPKPPVIGKNCDPSKGAINEERIQRVPKDDSTRHR